MPDHELKEYLDLKLTVLSGEIKEHINEVNDKARKDFNKRFESQEEKIEEIKKKANDASTEIRFAKRLGYGFAAFVSILGFEKFAETIKGLFS